MDALPLRLSPGDDLRDRLEAVATQRGGISCVVLAGIGSLSAARLRFAGASVAIALDHDLEILTLSGTLSPDGAHLHISVADRAGRVVGGHVARGCIVRTTAEVLLAFLPEWPFTRESDAVTGYAELVVRRIDDHD